jgi:hypothetical protein
MLKAPIVSKTAFGIHFFFCGVIMSMRKVNTMRKAASATIIPGLSLSERNGIHDVNNVRILIPLMNERYKYVRDNKNMVCST